jgi:hypothetical protein
MSDYSLILTTNFVGKQFLLVGTTYDGLQWLDSSPKPTQAELDALWESTQAAVVAKQQADKSAKDSALAKLAAIGLTEHEIKVLLGA